ncbi:MAG: hypothetical protein PHT99_07830 [Methanoregula sp.]|nr:hypothetical protein [Methanoregula sp.]
MGISRIPRNPHIPVLSDPGPSGAAGKQTIIRMPVCSGIDQTLYVTPGCNETGLVVQDCCDTILPPETHMWLCGERYTVLSGKRGGKGSTMHVTQVQLKMIAIGLIPVFFILTIIMPKNTTTDILLAMVIITAIVISFIGMRMQKREAGDDEDLLAIPPKRS